VHEVSDISSVAHAVQLALAPVFVLTAVAAMLTVLTNRLGRAIDRARVLEAQLAGSPDEAASVIHADLATLSRRAKLINRSITLCTITAILVCALIAVLFLSAFLHFDASLPVALLFILAMLSLGLALIGFLREVSIATAALRIGVH
jgi:uncharacterized protein DUF2721